MEKPNRGYRLWLRSNTESAPAEVKHFSKRRKIKQRNIEFVWSMKMLLTILIFHIPLVAASEEGTAQTNFL